MKIYLAAMYGRRLELCGYREQLRANGLDVQARWLDGHHLAGAEANWLSDGDASTEIKNAELRPHYAREDFEDCCAADLVVSFTEDPRTPHLRGGRHVEFGIALARGARVIVVGHRENIFHWIPGVEFAATWDDALRTILTTQFLKAPRPTPTGTEFEVCQDITRRQSMGVAKYGTIVKDNPLSLRQWLNHAYEEGLDKVIYLKRAMDELADAEDNVREFMVKAGQETPDSPKMPDLEVRKLRVKLIAEELCELCDAFGLLLFVSSTGSEQVVVAENTAAFSRGVDEFVDITDAYDAVIDLMVVTIGCGVAMGTHIYPGWKEVHRSNMSKFIDGHRREDGKWVKGPSYSPAKLRPIIEAQIIGS
jgi:predicted HAD superfamily Cof-like phosphohydrolase